MAFPDITIGPRELIESDMNKTGSEVTPDGKIRTQLTVDIDDKDLLKLTQDWKREWNVYWATEEKATKESEEYWVGRQYNSVSFQASQRPIVDNLIFESLETFLPEATKQNAEPVLKLDNTPAGDILGKHLKTCLAEIADKNHLRLKMKRQTRYWSIYKLGAIKVGWKPDTRKVFIDVVRTPKFILDKDATIDDGGIYTGEYLGEQKEAKAEKLIAMFPSKKEYITARAEGELGTKLTYIEWWTNELLFFTMGDQVLEKYRNPHWNYDEENVTMDEFGMPVQGEPIPGRNHFDSPQIPYVFLSVFNLGKHPLDDTSLITQNLANQDRVNATLKQVVKNVKRMNGGAAFSSEFFTKEESKEAMDALSEGDGVFVPNNGDIEKSYKQYSGTALPGDVYEHLIDMRSELRNIFGVKGSSAQGVASEQTVRGKIITSQKDASRIGGGISEYIEQCADRVYNWTIQLMYVYFQLEDFQKLLGAEKGQEAFALFSQYESEIGISVKEGSMLPKDELTEANQAIDLATAQLLSPIDLYKALDFPDPMETARNLFLWQNMPQALFPDIPMPQPGMVEPVEGGEAGEEEMTDVPITEGAPLPPLPPV